MAILLKRTTRVTYLGILKLASMVIGAMLWLACGNKCKDIIPPEYGMPHAEYKISGTIASADSLAPIPFIRIVLKDSINRTMDSTATDSTGKYVMQGMVFPPTDSLRMRLQAKDADGTLHGAFVDKDTTVVIRKSELTGGDGVWNAGHVEKTVDLRLTRSTRSDGNN